MVPGADDARRDASARCSRARTWYCLSRWRAGHLRRYWHQVEYALEPLLAVGARVVWHCDGDYRPLLDDVLASGVGSLRGFQRECGMELEWIRNLPARAAWASASDLQGHVGDGDAAARYARAMLRAEVHRIADLCTRPCWAGVYDEQHDHADDAVREPDRLTCAVQESASGKPCSVRQIAEDAEQQRSAAARDEMAGVWTHSSCDETSPPRPVDRWRRW